MCIFTKYMPLLNFFDFFGNILYVCAMIPHFGCGSKGMSLYTSFTVMIMCYYSGVAIRRRVSA